LAKHVFIIGGTGQIGHAAANELVRHGFDVTVSHRGLRPLSQELIANGIKTVILDRENQAELSNALRGGVDVVIDTVAYNTKHADQLLGLQNDIGAFIVISSSSVYCDERGRSLDEARTTGFPDLPDAIKETQITVSPGDQTYSTRKVALERKLLEHASIPATILRPCAIHGVGSQHPREWFFVKRILDGRRYVPLAYRGGSRFHTSAIINIASLIALVVQSPGTRILNAGDRTVLSVAEIGLAISNHLNYNGDLVLVDSEKFPPTIGANPWSVPAPFMLDNTAAIKLGYEPVTYQESIGPTCDWLMQTNTDPAWKKRFPVLADYPYDLFDYAAENIFLANMLL
jgi:nucleoside-diphosphate-sugar epimerase